MSFIAIIASESWMSILVLPRSELESIIDTYHAYKGHENGEFPLGDYREAAFKNNAAFLRFS